MARPIRGHPTSWLQDGTAKQRIGPAFYPQRKLHDKVITDCKSEASESSIEWNAHEKKVDYDTENEALELP